MGSYLFFTSGTSNVSIMSVSLKATLGKWLISVENPRDQMIRCTEFVTIFSSASGRIF